MPLKAAVFDIDGTLVTFEFDVAGTRQVLIGELANRGFEIEGLGKRTPTQRIVEHARAQIESGKVSADFDEVRKALYSILDKFEMESAGEAQVFPDTRSTLDRLLGRGVRLGVLTNSGRPAASVLLRKGGVEDCFEFVLTRDDVDAMKPSPEGLQKAASMFGMPVREVCYVGDSLYDVMAAKGAGLKIVAVATGNYTEDALREEGADYVIPSMSGLPAILGA